MVRAEAPQRDSPAKEAPHSRRTRKAVAEVSLRDPRQELREQSRVSAFEFETCLNPLTGEDSLHPGVKFVTEQVFDDTTTVVEEDSYVLRNHEARICRLETQMVTVLVQLMENGANYRLLTASDVKEDELYF